MSRPARGRLVDRLPGPPAQTARLEFRDTAPPAPGQGRPRHAEDAAQLAVGPAEAGLDPIHEADSPHRSRGIGEGARTLVDRPDLGAGDVGLHGRPIDTGAPEACQGLAAACLDSGLLGLRHLARPSQTTPPIWRKHYDDLAWPRRPRRPRRPHSYQGHAADCATRGDQRDLRRRSYPIGLVAHYHDFLTGVLRKNVALGGQKQVFSITETPTGQLVHIGTEEYSGVGTERDYRPEPTDPGVWLTRESGRRVLERGHEDAPPADEGPSEATAHFTSNCAA